MLKSLSPVILAIFVIAFNLAGCTNPTKTPPNIIVIMADDLGMMDLHCYGNSKLDTPALDRFASQGIRFTDAYAASPVCSPTRAAMMTGMSPARLHLTNHAPGHPPGFAPENAVLAEAPMVYNLALSYTTIAERLKSSGYTTAHIGKWHLSNTRNARDKSIKQEQLYPEYQGFDINIGGHSSGGPRSYFAPYKNPKLKDGPDGEYLPERLADEAIQFIQQNKDKDKPFFLSYWPYSVHYPMQAKEPLIEKYRKRVGPGIKDPVYAAMIEGMDAALGRFFDALDEAGLSDNTIVIFTSDNGGYNGDNRPLRGFKGMLLEGGVRVPFIARWPGHIKPGTTCNTPVISTDCVPTMIELAGLPPITDHPVDGESLIPLFKQTGELNRDAIYMHYPNYAFHKRNRLGSVIREGDYKLIKRYDDGSLELYDLAKDIGEKQNLAESKPQIAKRLSEKLNRWLSASDAQMPVRVTK